MLPADYHALRFISAIGPAGAEIADTFGKAAAERWRAPSREAGEANYLWRNWHRVDFPPTTASIAVALSMAIWKDVVAPRLKRTPYPSITVDVLQAVSDALGEQGNNGITAHRVFRWLVNAIFADQLSSEPRDAILVVGGLRGLADLLGMGTSSGAQKIGRVLEAMQAAGDGSDEGPWLRVRIGAAAPGRAALLRIDSSARLLPGYAASLPKQSHVERRRKKLVPIPLSLPPLKGRNNERGAQCMLQLLVLERMRTHAKVLCAKGGVTILASDWSEMAAAARVSHKLLPTLINAWRSHKPSNTAFLWQRGDDAYALNAPLNAAGDLLVQAAVQERNGARAQRRGLPSYRRPR